MKLFSVSTLWKLSIRQLPLCGLSQSGILDSTTI